jgi:predicted aldo/keto reductase-like oxidoreductase
VIAVQGVTFAIVVMKIRVVESQEQTDDALKLLRSVFPGIPTVIMAPDDRGEPKYQGPQELIDLLGTINTSKIPWKMYNVNDQKA